jgi:hypothetical protein
MVRYDGRAAVTCLSDISAGSCGALFRLGNLTLPASCSDVAPGTGQTGAPCEDLDFVCASDDCESSYCAAPSPDDLLPRWAILRPDEPRLSPGAAGRI